MREKLQPDALAPAPLMVGVGLGPVSEQVVRWTCQLAANLICPWIALYVETSRALLAAEQTRVTRNLMLARELGAEVITTTDEDVVQGLLRVASQRNVSQIVVGKPEPGPAWKYFQRSRMLRRLLRESGNIGVHAVALFVEREAIILAATLSALVWDYFFLLPVFAFRITHIEDAILLGVYLVVALVLEQLTARIRAQQEAERQREGRATALYLLMRELSDASDAAEIIKKVITQTAEAFKARVAVLLPDERNRLVLHPASVYHLDHTEEGVASWVWEHGEAAGKFTENLPFVEVLCVPLATRDGPVGVMGLSLGQSYAPTVHQRNLLEAFSRQIALALDRLRLNRISENAKVLGESERLSKTLLNSMSHEIRTPLSAIQSAISNLSDGHGGDLSRSQQSMITEIQEATERLNRLVGKVLEVTRLEACNRPGGGARFAIRLPMGVAAAVPALAADL